jgi:uncharacterized phage-associated protein
MSQINKKTRYTPSHVANYFLMKGEYDNIGLTPMKLIKLVYFAYGWGLILLKERLFDEKIIAYQWGPIIKSLLDEFGERYSKKVIKDFSIPRGEKEPKVVDGFKDKRVASVLEAVWDMYKGRSATELSDITHKEDSAWYKACSKPDRILLDEDIIERSQIGISKLSTLIEMGII